MDNLIIKKLFLNNYGIKIENIKTIDRGTANIYLIDNKYILKEYPEKYDSKSIEKEIDIIKYLSKKDFKVPEYLKTLGDKYYIENNNKVIIVQKYIKGNILKQNTGNYNQVIESAKMLGLIVQALENYPYELPFSDIKEWYSLNTFEEGKNKLTKLIEKIDVNDKYYHEIKKDLEDKISMIDNIKGLDYNDFNKLTYKNTHGDFSLMQFVYKNNEINGVLDFASAKKLPIVWEVIRSYSYIDKSFNIDNLLDYVKEFEKYVKLNEYDKKNMALLYLVQILTSSYGYKSYIEYKDEELLKFGLFRTNLSRYLYNNYELIGKKLMDEV